MDPAKPHFKLLVQSMVWAFAIFKESIRLPLSCKVKILTRLCRPSGRSSSGLVEFSYSMFLFSLFFIMHTMLILISSDTWLLRYFYCSFWPFFFFFFYCRCAWFVCRILLLHSANSLAIQKKWTIYKCLE